MHPQQFVEDVIGCLFKVHQAGFAHDDIKMSNCIYDEVKDQWLLIDFDHSSPLRTDWMYRGTPGYFAAPGPSSQHRDLMHVLLLLYKLCLIEDFGMYQEKLDLFEYERS